MSTPFVSNGYMYFQGAENWLWKVSINKPDTDRTVLGDHPELGLQPLQTASSPIVVPAQGTFPESVFFRGTDDILWRVSTDGTGLASPNCNWTKATPFVAGDAIFFQGTDDRLLQAWAYE